MQSQYRALHYSASRVNDHHSHMTGLILTGAWWNVFRFTLPVTLIQSFLKIHVTFNLSGIRPWSGKNEWFWFWSPCFEIVRASSCHQWLGRPLFPWSSCWMICRWSREEKITYSIIRRASVLMTDILMPISRHLTACVSVPVHLWPSITCQRSHVHSSPVRLARVSAAETIDVVGMSWIKSLNGIPESLFKRLANFSRGLRHHLCPKKNTSTAPEKLLIWNLTKYGTMDWKCLHCI